MSILMETVMNLRTSVYRTLLFNANRTCETKVKRNSYFKSESSMMLRSYWSLNTGRQD